MLGIGPKPEGAAVLAPHAYHAHLTGALLVILGISALILAALTPATLGVGWLPFALFGLPLTIGGASGAAMGYVALSTRIEIGQDGVVIATPGWRACPFPPVREYRLEWSDVRAVRHRTEQYRVGPIPLRLPLGAYAIETTRGFIQLGSYYLPDLESVLVDLAQRADRPWCEDDEVEADLFRTVLHGVPPWSTGDQHLPRQARDIASRARSPYGSRASL